MITPKRRRHQRRRNKSQESDPAIGHELDIAIETIGGSGDGIARLEGRPVFVPFSLPGDHLRVRLTARRGDGYAAAIVAEHQRAEQATPPCPHFGRCGGCQIQHLPADGYRHWKVRQIETALARQGLTGIDIRPLIPGKPATRRRLRLAVLPASGRRLDGSPSIGFRARQSREIVAIETCPIAHPTLLAVLPALNDLIKNLDIAGNGGEIHLTATKTGLDLLLETSTSPALPDLERLGAFAESQDLARLAWRRKAGATPEPIAIRRSPTVTFGGIPVTLPIGAFLQATEHAETAIREAIVEAVGFADRLADLFAGCGTFGLPLAAGGRHVLAIERDPAMVAVLDAAARQAGITSLKAQARDLEREPLDLADLSQLDAIILDPPRAGARRQVEAIVQTQGPPTLAMASCNPKTFARDARTLIDGGYRLFWLQPIDAFLWSAEIELAAAFTR